MKFDERFLDEIKARLRLSDVIGRTVKLRRQGREFVGLSPFNKEKSPSFFVNDDKGFYHDFSSGKHGDLISFLQETERLSFPEAVERLAAEAGLALPTPSPAAAEQERQRQSLHDWMELAAQWFEAELRRPAGAQARAYLDGRGLPEADRARFRLGYARAGRTALKDHLVAKGARPAELVEAGLLIAPEEGGAAPYDRFRDRVVFPIADGRGRIVSFGGRALDPAAKAKYLNGPETVLFHKSSTLYGLPEARRLLHTGGDAAALVVVEGYFDVVACQRVGIAAVAPMGTALTEEQMELLWRQHPEPTLSFDGDEAGRRAEARTLDRALPLLKPGRSLQFVRVTGGKDPDDVLREQGAEALKQQLSTTRPFVEVLFERERTAQPLNTPEHYAGLKVRLRKLAGAIADRDLSQIYKEALLDAFERLRTLSRPATTASDLGRQLQGLRRDRRTTRHFPATGGPVAETKTATRRLTNAPRPFAAAVAQAVIQHPSLLDDHLELLSVQGFGDEALDGLARELVRLRMQVDHLDTEGLRLHFAQTGSAARLQDIAWAADKAHQPFLNPDQPLEEVRALWSQAYEVLLRLNALERAMVDAKADLEHDNDVTTLMRLKAERDALARAVMTGTIWSGGAGSEPDAYATH